MTGSISENDWKYLRSIQGELLASLCKRINDATLSMLHADGKSEHARYLESFRHIKDSDGIIAECFNDWRRSTIGQRLISLHRHRLLTQTHLQHLSERARDFLQWSETL